MSVFESRPALALGSLGALSGCIGAIAIGPNFGAAPGPGLYLTFVGVWFAVVIAIAVWRYGDRSPAAVALAATATWIAWQAAVNVAMLIDPLVSGMSSTAGVIAGAVGALVTWGGVAAALPQLRSRSLAWPIVAAGAVMGALLPLTNTFDSGVALLVPWQSAVAAMIGAGIARARSRDGELLRGSPPLQSSRNPFSALPAFTGGSWRAV